MPIRVFINCGDTDGITEGPRSEPVPSDAAKAGADVLVGTVVDAVAVAAFAALAELAALSVFAAFISALPVLAAAFFSNDIFTIACCIICII